MKILITGSNGLLGQKLVALLSQDPSHQVIATSRGANRLSSQGGYTYESMDIIDAAQVSGVLKKYLPDAIVHTAAMTNVDECHINRTMATTLNVEAVKHLIDGTRETGAFLLHLSTDFVFDGKDGPYAEDAVPNPVNFYGETKLEAERLIQESGIHWAIVRTVLVYGIAEGMSRSNIILWVKNSLEQGKTLQVVDDQWRTPTLAEDLAAGCSLIVKKRAHGMFNISGKDFLTPYDMAIKTAEFFNLDKSLINKANADNFQQPAMRPPKTGFIIDKAIKELGFQPHSFEEGILRISEQVARRKSEKK